ncbi:ABC transporter permease [Moellerella wisconsensis]|uniref:ABC transporter permease n=2 Tax=Moellerella wisconsensis TaxID=158849 RepID=A0ACD3Y872_9GAMM|nr:FtsX-like permease family protein [Moellerella wisconsensis]UNH24461.1 ABC transporter permease [Moellerella wisconsensis]UNH27565.1 ABC transporter permease [Moellerella wisconsensis]UNH31039.1 ABC transporter permease [Moellerella wisconsensis]UNH39185.1 ABC transporter permease [Moellerella wisconsensis]UNH42706.1 ABC transporter permease [Moellerella wisconsensis]
MFLSAANPSRLRLLISLALRDLIHDRKVALCIIFSLVSVIAPLLLLFGLKSGIVLQLNQRLLNDPRNLEIRMIGNGNYPSSWFDALEKHPGVAFTIPLTRSLNTQADLVADGQHFVSNAEVIPTAKGDPLLNGVTVPDTPQNLVLSASAAAKLNVTIGDKIRLFVSRKLDGNNQRAKQTLTVVGIIKDDKFSRPAAFVPLSLLIAMEDYRDGYRAPELNVYDGTAPTPRSHFAKARLYADNIDAIPALDDWFRSQHVEVMTQKSQIESVKAISYVLNVIFSVIAWVSLLGCAASLIGAFLANIDRKRKDMAILRLLGFRQHAVSLYIILQALLLTSVAFLLAFSLYMMGSALFNWLLGEHLPEQGFIAHLTPLDILIAFICALFIALIVAGIGAIRAMSIQPAESLREI